MAVVRGGVWRWCAGGGVAAVAVCGCGRAGSGIGGFMVFCMGELRTASRIQVVNVRHLQAGVADKMVV
ncbi:hypothetical protein SAMN05421543_12147 [Alicyclobacillus macrosporangiidus]|uniref:Uncharacterized protein n=1 Tax=Alicyclobacillus macrosporangiidus TaxID=392015 RepID=A0A1I7KYZ6_9BACL|nr:hypothetical protein SAMN05421543_12147 [Alicyclobacillus macrosporangiidus]